MKDARIVSLRQVRKSRARAESRAQGAANAAKFGRTTAERRQQAAEAAQQAARLDGHRREPGDDSEG